MLTVSIKQIPLASFALAVNNVAIISSITVRNNTPNNYEGLKVRITFDPEFADTVVEHIVSLPAHESWKKTDIQPSINTSYLCNLTEKIKATTTVHVLSKDGEVLAESKKNLEVLDYCQYWGNSFMSQYLASYVLPYDKAIVQIAKRATELYQMYTDCVFPENVYKDTKHTLHIVRSIYESIQERQLSFAYPIKNLNIYGQRIRTSNEIMDQNKGCCLDMALLFCYV